MDWKDEYSNGIVEINDQHKELLRLFTKVEAAIARGGDVRDVSESIDDLREAVKYHFWFENGLMRMFGYPGAQEHADKHTRMLTTLKQVQSATLRTASYGELQTFLEGWLLKHICSTDRSYAEWILSGAPVVAAPTIASEPPPA